MDMAEVLERPPTDRLPSWHRVFTEFIDEKLDMPDECGTWQTRDYEIIDSNLAIPANTVQFSRHAETTGEPNTLLRHGIELMLNGEPIERVMHEYGSVPRDQAGNIFVVLADNKRIYTVGFSFLRIFTTAIKAQKLRLPEDRPTGIRVSLVD